MILLKKVRPSPAFPSAWLLLMFALITTQLPAAGTPSNSYSRALALFSQGNYEQGLKLYYRFILSENPLLSRECQKEDLRPAKDYFAKVLSQNPGQQKAKLFLGLIFRLVNKMDQANQLIDQLRQSFPNAPFLILVKGEFLLWQQKFKDALQFFDQIPANPKTAQLRSFAENLKKNSGISSVRTSGSTLPPKLSGSGRLALLSRVHQHLTLLERREAESLLLEMRSEFPNDLEVGKLLLELYLETNRFAATEKLLQVMKKAIPQSDVWLFIECKLRFKQRRFVDILKIIEPLQKKAPENLVLKLMNAEALFSLTKYSKALPLFRELAGKDSLNERLFLRLLYCLEYCGHLKEAIPLLEKRLAEVPDSPILHMELANLFLCREKWDDAIKHLKEALKSKPSFQKLAEEEIDFCTLQSTEGGFGKNEPADSSAGTPEVEVTSLGQLSSKPEVQEFLLQLEAFRQKHPERK